MLAARFRSAGCARCRPYTTLLVLGFLLSTQGSVAEELPATPVVADRLLAGEPMPLPATWAFSAGAAEPDFTGVATRAGTRFTPGSLPAGFAGEGWFWLDLTVPPELVGQPLALRGSLLGAAELLLDGEVFARWGELGDGRAVPRLVVYPPPATFRFERAGGARLAVHYANPDFARYLRAGGDAGFRLQIALPEVAAAAEIVRMRDAAGMIFGFGGIFATFGLLHLLLFAFERGAREHLWFAALCLITATLVVLMIYKHLLTGPEPILITEPIMNLAGLAFGLLALRLIYGLFRPRLPRLFRGFAVVALPIAVASIPAAATAVTWVFLHMLLCCVEVLRVVALAVWRRAPGARVVGLGLFGLALGFTVGLLTNLGVLPAGRLFSMVLPFTSMVGLIVAMSISLSRRIASTNRELRVQLGEVERLSVEALAQERRVQQAAAEHRLLAAEMRRKDEELEAARRLQLALLPTVLEAPPGYLIAARMVTATEVGGDTYDVDLQPSGRWTLVVGDATGHGAQAGVMVAAFKSLFGALAGDGNLVSVLTTANRALKRIGWRRLAMAATAVRLEDGRIEVVGAGMPPALLFRAATGSVEAVGEGGVPLGAMAASRYLGQSAELAAGDALLLASDGLLERRDAAGAELGLERVAVLFARTLADHLPGEEEALVDALVAAGLAFGHDGPLEDDLTVLVVRRVA